ncbi:MAG: hypothetical protein OEO83_05345 [Alphaproteobacteria bacterium]|nr:hypothetical protein [Alphaproteobacteria bacterium]
MTLTLGVLQNKRTAERKREGIWRIIEDNARLVVGAALAAIFGVLALLWMTSA